MLNADTTAENGGVLSTMTNQPEKPTANSSDNTDSPDNHQKQAACEGRAALDADDNGWRPEEREHKREERTYWKIQKIVSAVTLIFSFIAAGGAAAGAYIAFQAFKEAKRQADAAESQIAVAKDTEERQLRAYLVIDHEALQTDGRKIGTTIHIKHTGATPAYRVHFAGTVLIGDYPNSSISKFGNIWKMGGEIKRDQYTSLFGDDAKKIKVVTNFVPDALALMSDTRNSGNHRFYVFGALCHQDIFEKWRQVNFCFSYDPDKDKDGSEEGCDGYKQPLCPWGETSSQ